jgi:hypothetical protein
VRFRQENNEQLLEERQICGEEVAQEETEEEGREEG